ncbi:hypothetical protein HYPSUDRAFT_278556 [Hypholoma sublateritium FD-334 SS-4]|uniref:Uncharacterized protein n=1 Tax=Hypholoma sublateritium (strain FD-334 SS-4) TaxID=945553 RepID=A0A0D2P6J3_HYPSF|nr:hypothetical protein HYPSUDRAFT_278556 [Hypholoma sublateritium FD-334 SS-4]
MYSPATFQDSSISPHCLIAAGAPPPIARVRGMRITLEFPLCLNTPLTDAGHDAGHPFCPSRPSPPQCWGLHDIPSEPPPAFGDVAMRPVSDSKRACVLRAEFTPQLGDVGMSLADGTRSVRHQDIAQVRFVCLLYALRHWAAVIRIYLDELPGILALRAAQEYLLI